MEVKLKQEPMQQYSCVYMNTVNREETMESVVPDTMPDIAKILCTDCALYLRSKNIQDGKAQAEGNLQAAILYVAEDSPTVLRLELSKPVMFYFENEELREKDTICIRMQINSGDTRSLNPRKILLRADVQCEMRAFRREEWLVPTDVEEGDLQILTAETALLPMTHVGEKSFSVSEEFSMPAAHNGLEEILTARAWATVDEMKSVGEKMILQGTANLRILYLPKDETVPKAESFTTAFSQIMDCAENAAGPHTVLLVPTSLRLETMDSGGTPMILMDYHLTAQLICRQQQTLRYIADAYSLSGEETLEILPKRICSGGETMVLRETIRELLDTPEPVTDILDGFIQPGTPTVGERGIRQPLNVSVLYRTESGVSALSRRLSVDIACEAIRGRTAFLHPAACPDSYFAPASGGVEIRLPVEIRMDLFEENDLSLVNSVTLDDAPMPSENEGPSLTLVRCGSTDLWTLAKRYRTTREQIESANKNAPEIGQLLLIPRPR